MEERIVLAGPELLVASESEDTVVADSAREDVRFSSHQGKTHASVADVPAEQYTAAAIPDLGLEYWRLQCL